MLHQAICKFLEILGLDSDAYDNDDVEKTWAKRTLFDQKNWFKLKVKWNIPKWVQSEKNKTKLVKKIAKNSTHLFWINSIGNECYRGSFRNMYILTTDCNRQDFFRHWEKNAFGIILISISSFCIPSSLILSGHLQCKKCPCFLKRQNQKLR